MKSHDIYSLLLMAFPLTKPETSTAFLHFPMMVAAIVTHCCWLSCYVVWAIFVEVIHAGAPPGPRSGAWVTKKVCFRGYLSLSLSTTKGTAVISSEFNYFCHRWIIELSPGGSNDSDEGFVSIYLQIVSIENIDNQSKMIVRDPNLTNGSHIEHVGKVENTFVLHGITRDAYNDFCTV